MRRGPITVQGVRYNRNGITGEGFFVVALTLSDTPMLAVVFTQGDGPYCAGRDIHGTPILVADITRCALIDPAAPNMMHSAERFMPWLAEAIDRWVEDGRAFLDAA